MKIHTLSRIQFSSGGGGVFFFDKLVVRVKLKTNWLANFPKSQSLIFSSSLPLSSIPSSQSDLLHLSPPSVSFPAVSHRQSESPPPSVFFLFLSLESLSTSPLSRTLDLFANPSSKNYRFIPQNFQHSPLNSIKVLFVGCKYISFPLLFFQSWGASGTGWIGSELSRLCELSYGESLVF